MLFTSRSDVLYRQCEDVNVLGKGAGERRFRPAKLHIEDHGVRKSFRSLSGAKRQERIGRDFIIVAWVELVIPTDH